MSEKTDTDSIRVSQVLAGALAAITAAVLGSTMGVAGTVIGAGVASIVTTVGGALYMRSIHHTKRGVRTVRDIVVARAGGTSVTLVDERRLEEPRPEDAAPDAETANEPGTEADAEAPTEVLPTVEEEPPARRRLRWPALIAASVLTFVVGMMLVTGVELLRGAPLSGGEGTTVGGIVRSGNEETDDRDNAPPATGESTTPDAGTSTVTDTPSPSTSENEEPGQQPSEPETTAPDTTTDAPPPASESVPQPEQTG